MRVIFLNTPPSRSRRRWAPGRAIAHCCAAALLVTVSAGVTAAVATLAITGPLPVCGHRRLRSGRLATEQGRRWLQSDPIASHRANEAARTRTSPPPPAHAMTSAAITVPHSSVWSIRRPPPTAGSSGELAPRPAPSQRVGPATRCIPSPSPRMPLVRSHCSVTYLPRWTLSSSAVVALF